MTTGSIFDCDCIADGGRWEVYGGLLKESGVNATTREFILNLCASIL